MPLEEFARVMDLRVVTVPEYVAGVAVRATRSNSVPATIRMFPIIEARPWTAPWIVFPTAYTPQASPFSRMTRLAVSPDEVVPCQEPSGEAEAALGPESPPPPQPKRTM